MTDSLEKQSAEFAAVNELGKAFQVLIRTGVVDDDYPEVRHKYESAISGLIRALKENKRIT